LPFAFLLPFSLRRRGLFDIYICARSQLNNSTNGDLISGLKIAEYWRQVNPLMILRSAAFDVNPFDRAVTDVNDERAFCRHGYRRRQDEERRPQTPRGPGHSKIATVSKSRNRRRAPFVIDHLILVIAGGDLESMPNVHRAMSGPMTNEQ
jgi:hypothetical protein